MVPKPILAPSLLLLVACASPQASPPSNVDTNSWITRAVAICRARESVYDRARIEFKTWTPSTGEGRFICENWPGRLNLWEVEKGNRRLILKCEEGKVWTTMPGAMNEGRFALYYGTEDQGKISQVSSIILNPLVTGCLLAPGVTAMSRAISSVKGANAEVSAGRLTCNFTPSPGLFPRQTHYQLELPSNGGPGIVTFTISTVGLPSRKYVSRYSIDGRLSGNELEVSGGKSTILSKVEILSVTKMAEPPARLTMTHGHPYYDTVVQTYRYWGLKAVFQTKEAEKVLAAAKLKKQLTLSNETANLNCGQESLYYLSKFIGKQGLDVDQNPAPFGTTLGDVA